MYMYVFLAILMTFSQRVYTIKKIACEGSSMRIACNGNRGETISMNSLYYGRTSKTVCPDDDDDDTNCKSSWFVNLFVAASCHGKSVCYLKASNSVFRDPCSGIYKYLEVDYRCLKADSSPIGAVACENSHLYISCGSRGNIHIISANYGRMNTKECVPENVSGCRSSISMNIMSIYCENRNSCTVAANNDVFGDPCGGTFKYLEVKYICK